MKKRLGIFALCGAMLLSSPFVMAQDHHPGPPPHGGMYEAGHRDGWYKPGGHVPAEYRGNTYVVNNYNQYHLKAPPRGYHYIRSDNGDFLLAAVTTGAIMSIVASH